MAVAMYSLSTTGQATFQRDIGGIGDDRGHAIVTTQDGGYAVAGHSNSFGAGSHDIVVLKLDSNGSILWQKTVGGSDREDGVSIAISEVSDGGLVVTGTTSSFGGTLRNLYIFKLDASGSLLWDNQYDSGPPSLTADHGRGLLNTQDGNIVLVGTDDAHTFGSNDALVIKFDQDGGLLWKSVYGGIAERNDHLISAVELGSGNILVSGSTEAFGPGAIGGYVMKLGSEGQVLWAHTYGGNGLERLNGSDITSDSMLIVVGSTTSFGEGQEDILLCKIDTNGVLQWSKTYGGSADEIGAAVRTLPDGGFLISALSDSYSGGIRDIVIIRTNELGEVIWSKTLGLPGYDAINIWASTSLQLTDDGGFVLTGWADQTLFGGEDIVVVKSDAEGSNLCQDISMVAAMQELETIVTDTQTDDVGTVSSVSSSVSDASMVSNAFCCQGDPKCVQCEKTLVHFDLNACYADMGNGSNMDYSEFTPTYPNALSYADITASTLYRESDPMNKHSCTPGVEGSPAMCVGALNSCTYSAGHIRSVVFELTVAPDPDSAVVVTGLTFYEKAPQIFEWIGGASGPNNYPTRFGVRVLKNGVQIFSASDLPTSINVWEEKVFDFTDNEMFKITDSTTLRFELLGYCLIGNGAGVDAWDLDEVSVQVACEAFTGEDIRISGFVRNDHGMPIKGVVMSLSESEDFTQPTYALTDQSGHYTFESPGHETQYYVQALKNTNVLEGVSTLDIIKIQKHLLGLEGFQSPYQYIAADANRSNSVSALDIVTIRQLILGKITEFPGSPSWRFGNDNEELSLEQPWDFNEIIAVPNIGIDVGNAHMKAVKVGDVTGDAASLQNGAITARSIKALRLTIADQKVAAGQAVRIDVQGSDFEGIEGLQLALNVVNGEITDIVEGNLSVDATNYHTDDQGVLRLSWNTLHDAREWDEEILFTIVLTPTQNGTLYKMVSLNHDVLAAQAYMHNADEAIALEFNITNPIALPDEEQLVLEIVPNPFKLETTIKFYLEEQSDVTFTFYNLSGVRLKLFKDHFASGMHEVKFAGDDITSGDAVIFCQIATNQFVETRKLIISR
jgi:hypothetical protein